MMEIDEFGLSFLFQSTDLMIISIGSTRYTWVTMKNIGYHRVGWFSQVSQVGHHQTIRCRRRISSETQNQSRREDVNAD